jgi:hypothetical protein
MKIPARVFVLLPVFAFIGCSGHTTMQEGWGEATKEYHEASTVNPNGQPVTVTSLDGMKANQVVDAYRAESGEMSNQRVVVDVGSN